MNFKSDKEQKTDKIINNSYNEGEQGYEDFSNGTMKVHDKVISLYEDQIGDIIESRTLKALDKELYDIFIISPYYEKYKKIKRADGNDRIKMYYFFKEKLSIDKKYSPREIFIAFAEFFQVNYDQLYSEIGVLDKENLLKELNEKYGLTDKIKTKKLF